MIDKNECYLKLMRIKKRGINITESFNNLTTSEIVSTSVLKFLSENNELLAFNFYENLRMLSNKKNHSLYKNLVKEDLDEVSLSKAISSFITQSIIFSEKMTKLDRLDLYESLNIKSCVDVLSDYLVDMNPRGLRELQESIKKDLKLCEVIRL